jgi:Bacterial protein of unknown function (DUF882)
MSRSISLFFAVFTFAAAGLPVTVARATPPVTKTHKTARIVKAHSCVKPPVEIAAGAETATFPLVDCNGGALTASVEQISILARPGTAPKPSAKVVAAARTESGPNLAPGIRRIDPRLVERLEIVVDHFHKDGHPARVELVSGYRPKSAGSYHSTGRALDFKLDGVKNEDIVAFCKTLPDTGCGYYPNSLFVHIDAREHGAGHIAWIDASRPGEPPRYVTAWPAPGETPETQSPAAAPAAPPAAAPPALSLPTLPAAVEHDDTHASEQPMSRKGVPLGF